jgi:type II secretory pathway pseudopilin PulG
MGFVSAIISIALTVASAVYQKRQQKKMQKKAEEARKAAEEARKGFELVVDSQIMALPIVYGRAKIGGNRVFSKTSNSFIYTTTNANKVFEIGGLNKTINGKKNEFLITQQALCQGPIHACYDVIIDESTFLNDPVLVQKAEEGETTGAFRAEVHYDGGTPNSLVTVNAGERANAKFVGCAFMSLFIKLNRDDPQFGGVPDVAAFIEGKLVKTVNNGILSNNRIYSNNPAWVLLDYLLDYRKLSLEELDLPSFEAAAAICSQIMMYGAYTGGNIFRNALGDRNIRTRNIPLYEANIIIDSKRPHRENVESILETMGDARLVWSQGKYKLSLQYPGRNNNNIVVAEHINDDKLVLGEDISVTWPTAEDRFNNVTIRFSNEAENFKEDTVSWPPKPLGGYTKGIGGFVYPPATGWDNTAAGRFLNNYAVWNQNVNSVTLTWLIRPSISGDYSLKFTMDDNGELRIQQYDLTPIYPLPVVQTEVVDVTTIPESVLGGLSLIKRLSRNSEDWKTIKTGTVNLSANQIYRITVTATNNKGLKGAAATLTAPDGTTFWTTREPSYSGFETVDKKNGVYLAMLQEDNNVELEADLFFEGCTDYHHALAKAEEMVRTSRSAFKIKFSYNFKDKYLEPGDFISFSSKTVKIGELSPVYIRVDSVKLQNGLVAEVEGTRFDWTQLAWNVADNEYLKPAPYYNFEIPAPLYLEYKPDVTDLFEGPGSLSWPLVDDTRLVSYNLYSHVPGDVDASGVNIFKRLGSTPHPPFSLPALDEGDYIFGIKSVTSVGSMSQMTVTDTTNLSRLAPPPPVDFTVTAFGDRQQSVRLSWTIPVTRLDGTVYKNHFITEVYRSKTNNFLVAQKVGETTKVNTYVDTPSEYGTLYYWVRFVSYSGIPGEESIAQSADLDFWAVFDDSTFKPPAPFNLQASGGVNQILLTWERVDYTEGGGHAATILYGKLWPEGAPAPEFSMDDVLASVSYATVFSHGVKPGERWVYWAKELSRGNGLSDGYAGPVNATTSYDAAELIDALSSNGFDLNTEPFVHFTEQTTLPDGTVIPAGTYLKRGYIADASITSAKIKELSADKITSGFIAAERIQANSITAAKIDSRGLSIKDAAGNIILASGSPLDYSVYLKNKPTSLSGINSTEGSKLAGVEAEATKGATFGSNIYGQITSTNVSTYIASAAIGAAQIGSIALVGTSNFSVRTALSGARMDMDSRRIKVYDENGVLRVQLGNLTV